MAVHGDKLSKSPVVQSCSLGKYQQKGQGGGWASSIFQEMQWGHSCLEKELTGGMCRLKGNMNLKWSVAV